MQQRPMSPGKQQVWPLGISHQAGRRWMPLLLLSQKQRRRRSRLLHHRCQRGLWQSFGPPPGDSCRYEQTYDRQKVFIHPVDSSVLPVHSLECLNC